MEVDWFADRTRMQAASIMVLVHVPPAPSIHHVEAEASSLKLAKPGWLGSLCGGILARGTFPNVHCLPSRFPPASRAPIVYRNLIMARRSHVKFMMRLLRCNDQISPRLTRAKLEFATVIASRGCHPYSVAVGAAFDGSRN